jgi:hypothetical protein
MLLHGQGPNSGANYSFKDSSSNNTAVSVVGSPNQGSFTPYGSNWSTYFGGSTNALYAPASSAFNFGTGNYTIECWINQTTLNTNEGIVIDMRAANGVEGLALYVSPTGYLGLLII